ncbi:MAG TPA: ribonuclease M5 [Clostridia bacterium]|nr:ribonuclease M5 [Clostridia bacterium]
MKIKEVIVVEGKDDAARIKSCVDASVIITSGYGINKNIYKRIDEAYRRVGIIIFTDPDTVGARLRRMLLARYPKAKQAFILRSDGTKEGDIGVENASCKAIIKALEKVRSPREKASNFTMSDLYDLKLAGPGSKMHREKLMKKLGIECLSAKATLEKLNHYGITQEEIYEALRDV